MPADFILAKKNLLDALTSEQGLYNANKEQLDAQMGSIAKNIEEKVEDVRKQGQKLKD